MSLKKPLPTSPYQGRSEEMVPPSCPSPDKGRLEGVSFSKQWEIAG